MSGRIRRNRACGWSGRRQHVREVPPRRVRRPHDHASSAVVTGHTGDGAAPPPAMGVRVRGDVGPPTARTWVEAGDRRAGRPGGTLHAGPGDRRRTASEPHPARSRRQPTVASSGGCPGAAPGRLSARVLSVAAFAAPPRRAARLRGERRDGLTRAPLPAPSRSSSRSRAVAGGGSSRGLRPGRAAARRAAKVRFLRHDRTAVISGCRAEGVRAVPAKGTPPPRRTVGGSGERDVVGRLERSGAVGDRADT